MTMTGHYQIKFIYYRICRSGGKKGRQFNTYPVAAAGQILSNKTTQGQRKSLGRATSPLQNLWSHLSQKALNACTCSAVHVRNDSINEKDQKPGVGITSIT